MKAKDYFDKYDPKIFENPDGTEFVTPNGVTVMLAEEDEFGKIGADLIIEMNNEMHSLIKARKIRDGKKIKGVIEEMNDKFNAVDEMFFKKYGIRVLQRNGYRNFILSQIPVMKELYEVK